ncbi:hypothetical protein ACOZ38_25625 [Sphaerisporangium viridialbum]|uniref:hypothetical protein n=1 Tax=Sphaerisporangium viridialbum TaxID=46189 RepID=UPI003C7070BE
MISTVTGLLLTTDLNEGQRVQLLLADDGERLDMNYLSGALTLGDGDTEAEITEVEAYPGQHLMVAQLAHPGMRRRNTIASQLLDTYMPPAASRWWLDLRGGVALVGLCFCGNPADLADHVYDDARRVSDALPRGRNTR